MLREMDSLEGGGSKKLSLGSHLHGEHLVSLNCVFILIGLRQ